MYGAGDYFQIPDLKLLAQGYFLRTLRRVENLDALAEAIDVDYNSTPELDRGLRDIVVDDMIANNRDLHKDLLRKVPEFAFDLCLRSLFWILD